MAAWWDSLLVLQQVMFAVGCATTLFMIVQIILMLVGMDSDGFYDGDTGLDGLSDGIVEGGLSEHLNGETPNIDQGSSGFTLFGLRILTLRSLLAFLSIGSWVVYTLLYVMFWPWAVILGIVAGFIAAVGVAAAMRALYRLQTSGNININNAVGRTGEVYLTIPALRISEGKVSIVVQEKLTEFAAITDCDADLKTGTQIIVKEVIGNNVLVVEPVGDISRQSKN